ncbi:hypothetical protein BM1374166_00791 [Bartonella tribocorum]|nr:hypothetical protein BM1374166_00791 [Bartonella tribocorum]
MDDNRDEIYSLIWMDELLTALKKGTPHCLLTIFSQIDTYTDLRESSL